ncbi:unnamed protein product [Musa textilis]
MLSLTLKSNSLIVRSPASSHLSYFGVLLGCDQICIISYHRHSYYSPSKILVSRNFDGKLPNQKEKREKKREIEHLLIFFSHLCFIVFTFMGIKYIVQPEN